MDIIEYLQDGQNKANQTARQIKIDLDSLKGIARDCYILELTAQLSELLKSKEETKCT